MTKIILTISAFIIGLFLAGLSAKETLAQSVIIEGNRADNMQRTIDNCLSAGGTPAGCAWQASNQYGGTISGDCTYYGTCNVTCKNGSTAVITGPKPPPTNPPSASCTPKCTCQTISCPGGGSYQNCSCVDQSCKNSITTGTCPASPGTPPSNTIRVPLPPPNNPPPNNPPPVAPPPNNPPPPPASSPTPFPTPTPDFNEAMCKCDSLSVQQIMLNQPIQVEAFAKVEGQDTSKATVRGMKFRIYEGNASTGRVTELSERGNQPVSVISETSSLVRYRSEWSANPTFKVGTEYRIVATPDCAPRTAAIQRQVQTAVLAERDENVGLFGQIVNFFAGLFGRGNETGSETNNQNSNNIFSTQQSDETNERLRLETFIPAQMSKEACNIVKFKFDAIQ